MATLRGSNIPDETLATLRQQGAIALCGPDGVVPLLPLMGVSMEALFSLLPSQVGFRGGFCIANVLGVLHAVLVAAICGIVREGLDMCCRG